MRLGSRTSWAHCVSSKKSQSARLERIGKALKIAIPELLRLDVELEGAGQPHLIASYKNWRGQGVTQKERQFSDGTLRLIGLLWSMFEGAGPLLIEEPELSLHTEIVSRIPALLEGMNSARREPRQVLISTHSRDLLRDPGIAAEEVLRLAPGPLGTEVLAASQADRGMMEAGLSAADVLLPQTAPAGIENLPLAF